jgi:hypothetical protein
MFNYMPFDIIYEKSQITLSRHSDLADIKRCFSTNASCAWLARSTNMVNIIAAGKPEN